MPILVERAYPRRAPGVPVAPTNPGSALLRVKEVMASGPNPITNPTWDLTPVSPDPTAGILTVDLPAGVVEKAGVYQLSWAIIDSNGRTIAVENSFLVVERSAFALSPLTRADDLGPPTLSEIRQHIMDSAAVENTLLDNLQFDDTQIVAAIRQPVDTWNNTSPPMAHLIYTTMDFPYREPWLRAISGHLHILMANHFRRNNMPTQGGGIMIADKDKEREYMAEGQRLLAEYRAWVEERKISLNTAEFMGTEESGYMGRFA